MSPNYQRLLEHGDAREVGDILAAGSESTIEKRLRAFADAGRRMCRSGSCRSARAVTNWWLRRSGRGSIWLRSKARSDGSGRRPTAGASRS